MKKRITNSLQFYGKYEHQSAYSAQDCAMLLNYSYQHVRRLISRGFIAHTKAGALTRITRQDLINYWESHPYVDAIKRIDGGVK